jgi:hypothetical protein
MAAMSLKETILREIESLPEQRQADVLAFVRFLKIGLADRETVKRNFAEALARARAIAAERGLTEQDINDEIQAARTQL